MSGLSWLTSLLLIATAACTRTPAEPIVAPPAYFEEEFTPEHIPIPPVDWSLWQPGSTGRFDIYVPDAQADTFELLRVNTVLTEIDRLTDQSDKRKLSLRVYPDLIALGQATERMGPVYQQEDGLIHICPVALPGLQLNLAPELWAALLPGSTPTLSLPERMNIVAKAQAHAVMQGSMRREVEHARGLGQRLLLTQISDHLPPPEARSSLIEYYRAMARVPGEVEKSTAGSHLQTTTGTRNFSSPEKLKGMTFAHEGYRVYNGYGGSTVKQSLDHLARVNVNSLAVVPYTFQRDPAKANHLHIPYSAGGENDAATTYSLRQAKERGWFTLLKPQIWVGRNSWPGDINFDDETSWEAWFQAYEYWILHYALLAEREGVDALCIGTELVRTTLNHPARWRGIIADIRSVYSGKLTYAANWGEEFENLSFWSDLDAMGLNSYYPISKSEAPTDAELLQGARDWLTMAATKSRETGRPLWLTEVGFRSVETTWENPHAGAGERESNNEAQVRAYRALTIAAEETPELQGIFVWKWPSYLGYDLGHRMDGKGFTPQGKPAAGELARFYGSW